MTATIPILGKFTSARRSDRTTTIDVQPGQVVADLPSAEFAQSYEEIVTAFPVDKLGVDKVHTAAIDD